MPKLDFGPPFIMVKGIRFKLTGNTDGYEYRTSSLLDVNQPVNMTLFIMEDNSDDPRGGKRYNVDVYINPKEEGNRSFNKERFLSDKERVIPTLIEFVKLGLQTMQVIVPELDRLLYGET